MCRRIITFALTYFNHSLKLIACCPHSSPNCLIVSIILVIDCKHCIVGSTSFLTLLILDGRIITDARHLMSYYHNKI